MSETEMEVKRRKDERANVRFNSEEYERIRRDAQIIGESIPKLLKDSYFSRPILNPLMRHDDLIMMVGQLGRIGNNLNQVAKHLNSGFRAGFNDDLEEIRQTFTRPLTFVTSTYGRRTDK